MIKNKESLVKQFRNDDPSTYLTNVDQQKAMLLDTIDDAKQKPKKRVVEPVEIPEVLSVPRLDHARFVHGKKTIGMVSNINLLPESYNTRPETAGLSQRFTQDRLREGKILKQLDREMASERMNSGEEKTEEEV